MHKTGNLWPNEYMQVFFQCGLFNYFLEKEFDVVAPGGLINKIPSRELRILFKRFGGWVEVNQRENEDVLKESVVPILRSLVKGLCDNTVLMHVGADYQIGKVRLEKMDKGDYKENKDRENIRVDLLQDYCFTFVHYAVKRLEEMTKSAREKKTKIEASTIYDFFSIYTVSLNGIDMDDLVLLETCDLGREDKKKVPYTLQKIYDNLQKTPDNVQFLFKDVFEEKYQIGVSVASDDASEERVLK